MLWNCLKYIIRTIIKGIGDTGRLLGRMRRWAGRRGASRWRRWTSISLVRGIRYCCWWRWCCWTVANHIDLFVVVDSGNASGRWCSCRRLNDGALATYLPRICLPFFGHQTSRHFVAAQHRQHRTRRLDAPTKTKKNSTHSLTAHQHTHIRFGVCVCVCCSLAWRQRPSKNLGSRRFCSQNQNQVSGGLFVRVLLLGMSVAAAASG